jgi:hypothetical protein
MKRPAELRCTEKNIMADANSPREQAKRCRELAQRVADPELIKQLELWAMELDVIADTVERSVLVGEPEEGNSNS